jgi:23S rRNA (cytidine1920-2'-O)/16S rRNA (cytidine1409-2'-O)-methyltransferase
VIKKRLDIELVERNLVPSRKKAQALIMAREVSVDGLCVDKPDKKVTSESKIEIKKRYPYVSRGAFKIKRAFSVFSVDVSGLKIIDIGISTGGFSDFMLKNGAKIITGIDVNIQQVDYQLRKNQKLKLVEKNARNLNKNDIDYDPDLITIDVSFISVLKILPALQVFQKAKIMALIKPQFEAEKKRVGKGGIIKNDQERMRVLQQVKEKIEKLNYTVLGITEAGIKGRKGNREFFFFMQYGKKDSNSDTILAHE